MMTKRWKQEYVQPVPGLLVVIPKQGLHFTDLKKEIEDARLDATLVTESFCKINAPHGKEVQQMRRLRKLPFVAEVQRSFHFDPPN